MQDIPSPASEKKDSISAIRGSRKLWYVIPWIAVLGGISFVLLGLSAFVMPGYWITDNMSFFVRQFLIGGTGFVAVTVAGIFICNGLKRLYRYFVFILCLLMTLYVALVIGTIFYRLPLSPSETTHAKTLRFVSINLEALPLGDERLTCFLKETDPDILVLQETEWHRQRYFWRESGRDFPIAGHAPYATHSAVGDLGNIVLFSKLPITNPQVTIIPGTPKLYGDPRREIIKLNLHPEGQEITLFAIHPASPRSETRWLDRRSFYEALEGLLDQTGQRRTVVIGDWNMSPWSGNFQNMLEKNGLMTRFPDGYPETTRFFYTYILRWFLGVTVDHVVATKDIQLLQVRTGPNIGSDHLPLVVDLSLLSKTNAGETN